MSYDIDADLRALEAMAANLTPYLYEDELFGTLSANLPKLTVGGILMRQYRLEAIESQLTSDQRQILRDANINFEQLRSEWMVHYEAKVQREIESRLRSLRLFIEDLAEAPKRSSGDYRTEAEHRLMVHHLKDEADELDIWLEDYDELLGHIDSRLRELTVEADEIFILQDELQSAYPSRRFWWLYRQPAE